MLCVLTVQELESQSPLPPSSTRVWPQAKIQIKPLRTPELLRQASSNLGSILGSSQMANYSIQLMQYIHTGLSWEAREIIMVSMGRRGTHWNFTA